MSAYAAKLYSMSLVKFYHYEPESCRLAKSIDHKDLNPQWEILIMATSHSEFSWTEPLGRS